MRRAERAIRRRNPEPDRFFRETAVHDFDAGAGGFGSQFPADDSDARSVVVPVRNPGIEQSMRRIDLQNVAVTLELTDLVDDDVSMV